MKQSIPTVEITWPNGIVLHRVENPHAAILTERLAHFSGVQKQRANKQYPFPGPNPVSIDRGDYVKFAAQPYHITEKTDGIRALMLITDIDGVHLSVVFDRTLTPYLFPMYYTPRALYQGTLLDGELVYDKVDKTWVFLCFDALNIAGVPVFHIPFTKRLEALTLSLKFYKPSPSDPGTIRPKMFLPFIREVEPAFLTHLETMAQRYDVDGVIFMPEHDRVMYGRHDNLLKLKTAHSIDFLVKGGKLYIYDENTRRNKLIGMPTGPDARLATEGAIVECTLDPSSKKTELWTVLGVRTDKTTSNNKFTFDKTLLNMHQALTFHDVLQGAFEVSSHGNPIWN